MASDKLSDAQVRFLRQLADTFIRVGVHPHHPTFFSGSMKTANENTLYALVGKGLVEFYEYDFLARPTRARITDAGRAALATRPEETKE